MTKYEWVQNDHEEIETDLTTLDGAPRDLDLTGRKVNYVLRHYLGPKVADKEANVQGTTAKVELTPDNLSRTSKHMAEWVITGGEDDPTTLPKDGSIGAKVRASVDNGGNVAEPLVEDKTVDTLTVNGLTGSLTDGTEIDDLVGTNLSVSGGTLKATDTDTQLSDEDVQDLVAGLLSGSGATSVSYDDSNDSVTVESTDTNTQLSGEQVEDIVAELVEGSGATSVSYDDTNGTLTVDSTDTDTQLSDEEVQDVVADFVLAGNNVAVSYDDSGNVLSVSSTDTNTQLSDEEVEDIIGGLVTGSGATSVSYDDSNGTLTVESTDTDTQLSDEDVQDVVGGLVTGSGATSVSYDDSNDVLTVSSTDTDTQLSSEEVEDMVASYLLGGNNVQISYDDANDTLTIDANHDHSGETLGTSSSPVSTVHADVTNAGELSADTSTTAEKPVYDVASYGATGDGSTDDTAAIQSAIDTGISNGGGTVYLPNGTYVISDELVVGDGISIEGDGRDATAIETDQSGSGASFPGAMIAGTDVSDFHLEGLSMVGPGVNASYGAMLYLDRNNADNVPNVSVEDVFGEGFAAGNAFAINTPIMCNFRNLRVQKVSGTGIAMFNGGTSVNMDNCYTLTCTEAGFFLQTITYSTLRGCAAEGCGVGYDFDRLRNSAVIGCGAEENFYRTDSYPGVHYRFVGGSHNELNTSYARGFVDNGDVSQLAYIEADNTELDVEQFRGVYETVAPSDDYRVQNGATVGVVESDFEGPGRTGTPVYERADGDVISQSVTTGELSVTRDFNPAGTESVHFNFLPPVEYLRDNSSGSGFGAISKPGALLFGTGGTQDSLGECWYHPGDDNDVTSPIEIQDWSRDRSWRCYVSVNDVGEIIRFGNGLLRDDHQWIGFEFDSGALYAVSNDSNTKNRTQIDSAPSPGAYDFRMEFTSGTRTVYYVDGTQRAEHTSNLPSGDSRAPFILAGRAENQNSATDAQGGYQKIELVVHK
jgi:hypothetical protein